MKKRARYGTGCVYSRRRKDGSIGWYFKFHVDGRPVVRNAHTSDREEAERQLALMIGEKAKGVPMQSHALTFEEAVNNLKAANAANGKETSYAFDVYLLDYFGRRTKMASISTPQIRRYIDQRKADGASNGTINRTLTALGRAFSLAMQDGVLHSKPFIPKLKEASPRSGFFERPEYEAVVRHLPDHLGQVVTFGYLTGWRLREILNLKWSNVDLKAGEVRLWAGTTKNGEGRTFPLTTELRQLLEQREAARQALAKRKNVLKFTKKESDLVFTRKNGGQILSFRKWWNRACVQAKCQGRLFHDLRRSAVRNFVRQGIPERVAMTLTGHKTRSVFERYNITSTNDLHDAKQRMEGVR